MTRYVEDGIEDRRAMISVHDTAKEGCERNETFQPDENIAQSRLKQYRLYPPTYPLIG